MKRIRKVKPKEISLVQAGANRRLIATYKSATAAEKATEMQDLREQILKTDPALYAKFEAIAKSSDAKYSPQAASVIKAVGRMLAPLAGQISMEDLTKIGSAAGLGGGKKDDDEGSVTKAIKKPVMKDADDDEDEDGTELEEDETEDSEDDEGEDQGEAIADKDEEENVGVAKGGPGSGPHKGGVANSGVSERAMSASKEANRSGDMDDHRKATEAHRHAAEGHRSQGHDSKADFHEQMADKHSQKAYALDIAEKSAKGSDIVALSSEKLDTEGSRAEAAQDAQGDSVAKSATTVEPSDKSRFEEIEKTNKAHQARIVELEAMVAKRSKDLDEERLYRETEAIKKSAGQDYAHLNFEADKLAPALKFLRDAQDQSHHETIHGLLKSASTQVAAAQKAAGIFKSVASVSAKGSPDDTNFEDTIEANVDQLMLKSENAGRKRPVVYDEYVTKNDEGRTLLRNARNQKRGY